MRSSQEDLVLENDKSTQTGMWCFFISSSKEANRCHRIIEDATSRYRLNAKVMPLLGMKYKKVFAIDEENNTIEKIITNSSQNENEYVVVAYVDNTIDGYQAIQVYNVLLEIKLITYMDIISFKKDASTPPGEVFGWETDFAFTSEDFRLDAIKNKIEDCIKTYSDNTSLMFGIFGNDNKIKLTVANKAKEWLSGKKIDMTKEELSIFNKGSLNIIFNSIKSTPSYQKHYINTLTIEGNSCLVSPRR